MFAAIRRIFGSRKKSFENPDNPNGGYGYGWPVASPQFAENLSGIASCVSLIAGTLAGLPAQVWARTPGGDSVREAAPLHPLSRIIRNGSGGFTWGEILEAWIADCLLSGNGLLEIQTDSTGRLSGLRWLPWSRISVQQMKSGGIVYNFSDLDGSMKLFLPDEVVHLRDRLDSTLPYLGKSRLQRSPGVIQLASVMHTTAQSFTGNLVRLGGYLTAPQRIDDDTAKRIREDFNANYSGKNSGKAAVLGNGLEYKSMTNGDAQAAQLVEQLVWSLQELSRLYLVPASLIGDTTASTFSNSATAARAFAMFCLAPWVQKIEEAFDRAVLYSPFEISLDLSELMRGDTETYFKSLALFRNSKVLTANELRVATGFNRHTDPAADELEAVAQGGAASNQPSDDPAPPGADKPGAKPAKGLNGSATH